MLRDLIIERLSNSPHTFATIAMKIEAQIQSYIDQIPVDKQGDISALHQLIIALKPGCKLWFFEGKDEDGKVVSNPNIGYGNHLIVYKNGSSKAFYKLGISANSTGISMYVMGTPSKDYLNEKYGQNLGKAKITGYCIKFKSLKDLDLNELNTLISQELV